MNLEEEINYRIWTVDSGRTTKEVISADNVKELCESYANNKIAEYKTAISKLYDMVHEGCDIHKKIEANEIYEKFIEGEESNFEEDEESN